MTGPATLVYNSFETLNDPRADRGHNHSLHETIFIALTAAICGSNGWADVERFGKAKRHWFERYLELAEGIPSHDTFEQLVDVCPQQLLPNSCLSMCVHNSSPNSSQQIGS